MVPLMSRHRQQINRALRERRPDGQGRFAWALLGVMVISVGCAASPPPRAVYQDAATVVRIQTDSRAGQGHSHPARIGPDEMERVLDGLRVQPRRSFVPSILTGEAPLNPAFTREDRLRLAPHLSQALADAKPGEIVTFYRRISDATVGLAVTSGGLFAHGPHLYVVLANARTLPSEGMNQNMVTELDPLDSPLLPISRTSFRAAFEPGTSVVPEDERWPWTYIDQGRVVVIDLVQLRRDSRARIEPRGQ